MGGNQTNGFDDRVFGFISLEYSTDRSVIGEENSGWLNGGGWKDQNRSSGVLKGV